MCSCRYGVSISNLHSCCQRTQNSSVALANSNPEMGIDIIIFRGRGNLGNQSLPKTCYVQNAAGQFLDYSGAVLAATGKKILRPTSPRNQATICSDALFLRDADLFKKSFANLFAAGLSNSVPMRVNEDGENFILNQLGNLSYHLDPVVTADYAKSGIAPLSDGTPDWLTYTSQWRLRLTEQFRAAFLPPGAHYSEYQVQGSSPFFGRWDITRQINTPYGATHLSTSDFYPWVQWTGEPAVWDIGQGSWHGLDWIALTRSSEIAAGDSRFSPFVAAGWSEAEELNLRPGRWLGLLKMLSALGAEWFYGGFFSVRTPFPAPENWIWQAASPSYAQAVTSQAPEFLFDGQLLPGDMPWAPIQCMVTVDGSEPIQWAQPLNDTDCAFAKAEWRAPLTQYRFWAGSQAVVVMVRNTSVKAGQYLISATVQPQSGQTGNAPLVFAASFFLQGTNVTVPVRQQGSVYVLDNSTNGPPTLTQLDGWHEQTHPLHWSSDIVLEAELHEAATACRLGTAPAEEAVVVQTYGERRDLHLFDFSSFDTVVLLSRPGQIRFRIRPRGTLSHPNGVVSTVKTRCFEPAVIMRSPSGRLACTELSTGTGRLLGQACTSSRNLQRVSVKPHGEYLHPHYTPKQTGASILLLISSFVFAWTHSF